MAHAVRRALAGAALAAFLAGCGGGGSGDAPAPPASAATLSGNAVKGPVSGATVRAYALGGGVAGAPLGSVMTDANGAFTMPLGGHAGPMLLQMTGGTYVDEATGAVVAMGPGTMLTAVLSSLPGGSATVQVTPLTAMAQAMAERMPGGMTPANIDAANAAIGSYFMVADILHTRPMNPLVAGAAAGATQPMMNYGMTLAAMAQYAKDAGMPSAALVTAMMNDAADGVLDGRAGTVPVPVVSGMMGGGAMLQPAAGGTGLASAMVTFMASGSHRAGLTTATMAPLTQHLTLGGGRMR